MNFIFSKIGYVISVVFGVYTVLFFLLETTQVDASLSMLDQRADSFTKARIESVYHFSQPVSTRYFIGINRLSPIGIISKDVKSVLYSQNSSFLSILTYFPYSLALKSIDLGKSYQDGEEVAHLIWDAMKQTMILAFGAIIIAVFFGISFGMMASIYHNKWLDQAILAISTIGISAPSFFVGIILALSFGFYWSDWTGLSFRGSFQQYDDYGREYWSFRNAILPILAIGFRPVAMITQLTRNAMLEVLNEDYIRTAYSKGLSKRVVVMKHAFRNALNPVITSISGTFASMLGGTYFIEVIFDIKGLGSLTVNALLQSDIPVVIGCGLTVALFYVLITIAADVAYRLADPRIRI